jgi:prepilin-type N-terminal cleavage/methylation domain-containing protein
MTRTLRTGFTLVELLVVMSLVVVLAGLTVAVAESGAFGSQKVVSAADRASGWLLIAKQRALRDQRPRGVRFLLSPGNGGSPTLNPPGGNSDPSYYVCREAQYIEIPDAWAPGGGTTAPGTQPFIAFVYTTPPNPNTYVVDDPPPAGTGPASDPNGYSIKPQPNPQRVFAVLPSVADQGDFSARAKPGNLLVLPNQGGTYRIDQIFVKPTLTLTLNTPSGPIPYSGGQVAELVLGRGTVSPATATFTYPDLGAATSGPSAGTQLAPPSPCKTETRFAFTSGIDGGLFGTGGAQPLVGEPLLQLTGQTIVIDVRANNTTLTSTTTPALTVPTTGGVTLAPPTGVPQYFDILFSPSGQVLGATGGLICLWVRDGDKTPATPGARPDFDQAGEQVLVTIYPRTGAIATHPVQPGTTDAEVYRAAQDGLNSGL